MPSVHESLPRSSDVRRASEPERRQLTIIFCDLVGSTELSSLIDPEDLSEIYVEIRTLVSRLISDFGGQLAGFQGDGIVAYFGYPVAHENDAQRAVQAAIEIMTSLKDVRHRCLTGDRKLNFRIGVHTGIAVVGDLGQRGSEERMGIIGEAPNVAARLQALAQSGSIVISSSTERIVAQQFECRPLGRRAIKGLRREVELFEVLGARRGSTLPAVGQAIYEGFSGRELEISILREHWASACTGKTQIIMLRGEAGIGKSRLLSTFVVSLGDNPPLTLVCQGSPLHEVSSLLPIIDMVRQLLRLDDRSPTEEQLQRLRSGMEAVELPIDDLLRIVAPLLGVPLQESRLASHVSPRQDRRRLLRGIVDALVEGTKRGPILLMVEDLHWLDSSTLEVLEEITKLGDNLPLMLVGSLRPEFAPRWIHDPRVKLIDLGPLERDAARAIVTAMPGTGSLPSQVIEAVLAKAEGIPLFIEELTRSALEARLTQDDDLAKSVTAPPCMVPAMLNSALLARLDRLGDAKPVCQLAAVIGAKFRYDLLQAVSAMPDQHLRDLLGQLTRANLVRRVEHGIRESYTFRHSLLRDAIYESLLLKRRRQLHEQIGELLEIDFPEICDVEPEIVAQHFMLAGAVQKSVAFWEAAARRASRQASYIEAIAHLQQALTLLKSLPESIERDKLELKLCMTLGGRYLACKGNAAQEVHDAFDRTRQLSEAIGDPEALFGSMRGLQFYFINRGALKVGRDMGERLLSLAREMGQPAFLLEAHRPLGLCQFFMGDLRSGFHHLSTAVELHGSGAERPRHLDYGVESKAIALSNLAWVEHFLGQEEHSIAHCVQALQIPSDPYSRAFAFGLAASVHQCRADPVATMSMADQVRILATDHAYPYWMAWARILHGWSAVYQTRGELGLEELQSGLKLHESTGAQQMLPYFLTLLGETFSLLGAFDEAYGALGEAITRAERTSLRFYEPESHRLAAEVARRQGANDSIVMQHLGEAIDLSRRQGSEALEKLALATARRLLGDGASSQLAQLARPTS
jgi:class 3 adenylate cyclase/tetratricopeptide (TPR) repeat protein